MMKKKAAKKEKKPLVLVVDDNEDLANVVTKSLQYFGYQTAVAYCGRKGISLFKTKKPQFVFLDIGMPDMDGYEVAREIRKLENKKTEVILIAMTGYGQEEDKNKSREAGFSYHLTKPVSLHSIKALLGKK